MSRLTKGIVFLALLFLPSAGCTGSCVPEPERDHAADSNQDNKVSLETIQAILAQSKEGLTSTKELVDKIATLNSDLAEEAKVFEAQEILRAIPLQLETEKTKQQIRSAVEALELRAQRIQVEYHEVREKKGLPRYYSDAPPYPFVDDELEEVIRIQIDLPESTPDQLSALAEALIRSEPRLLKPLPIEHLDGFSRLRTEMFRFRQISPPTQSFSPPSKELMMKAQGFPAEGPSCAGDKDCLELIRQIDGVFAELQPLRHDAELALRLEGELDMWKARRALFDKRVQEIHGLSARTQTRPSQPGN